MTMAGIITHSLLERPESTCKTYWRREVESEDSGVRRFDTDLLTVMTILYFTSQTWHNIARKDEGP
jgi:hypothetical protein